MVTSDPDNVKTSEMPGAPYVLIRKIVYRGPYHAGQEGGLVGRVEGISGTITLRVLQDICWKCVFLTRTDTFLHCFFIFLIEKLI